MDNSNINRDQTMIDLNKNNFADIDFNSFLDGDKTMHEISTSGDLLLISDCSESHKTIKTIFKKKFDSLKVVFKWWSEGNLSSVINAIKLMKDKIIMTDFFIFALLKNDINKLPFNLDLINEILIMSTKLCQDKYETYIRTGIEVNYQIIKLFLNKYFLQFKNDSNYDGKIKNIKDQISIIYQLDIIKKVKEKKYNNDIYKSTMNLVSIIEETTLSMNYK